MHAYQLPIFSFFDRIVYIDVFVDEISELAVLVLNSINKVYREKDTNENITLRTPGKAQYSVL